MSNPMSTRTLTGSVRFHELLKEIGDLHDSKQVSYGSPTDPFANVRGSTEFGIPGWVGALLRGNDKMKRLQNHAKGQQLTHEGARDSFLDLAVYSLIAAVLYEEQP